MRHLPVLLLPTLAACRDNLTGSWEGACQFSDLAYSYDADVELEISDGRGAIIVGTVDVEMWDDQVFAGDLEGERNQDWIRLAAEFPGGTTEGDYGFEVLGRMEGRDIVGECRFSVPGGAGALVGAIELER